MKKYFFPILIFLTIVTAIASLCAGSSYSANVSPWKVAHILLSRDTSDIVGRIIILVRLPRTLGALAAGSAIAGSGVILQAVLANPLAGPGIIGINSGAGLAVVISLVLLPPAAAAGILPFAAFAGSLCAALIVVLTAKRSGASRMTIVLAGIAISFIINGIMDAILTAVPDALGGYSNFRIGSLSGLTLAKIAPASAIIAIALLMLLFSSNELDVLSLGEDTAAALGMNVQRTQMFFLILSAALSGAAVSFCGMISFVGLIVPHICRTLTGAESKKLIPASIICGAFFLNLCDLAGRIVARPYEFPVGIILSLTGGPFFLTLIYRQHRRTRS